MPVDAERTPGLTGSMARAKQMSRANHGYGVLPQVGDGQLIDELHGWIHPHDLAPRTLRPRDAPGG